MLLETFIGTFVLISILVIVPLVLTQRISFKLQLKHINDNIDYIGDYILSQILFTFLTAIGLLYYVYIYYSYIQICVSTALLDSGLLFILLGAIVNIFIRGLHCAFIKILFKKTTSVQKPFLCTEEKNWTTLFICITYAFTFFLFSEKTYAFSYSGLVISFFFWLSPTKDDILIKVESLKSLTTIYWVSIIFLLICSLTIIRYKGHVLLIIAATLGIIVGFLIGGLLMYRFNIKWSHMPQKN